MVSWADCEGGWVNLSMVQKIFVDRNDGKSVLIGRDGEVLGTTDEAPDDLTAEIVPAAANAFVRVVYIFDEEPRTTVERQRVAAWKVVRGDALPVLYERPSTGCVVLIETDGPQLIEPYNRTYDDLATAIRALVEDYDRRKVGKEGK